MPILFLSNFFCNCQFLDDMGPEIDPKIIVLLATKRQRKYHIVVVNYIPAECAV